MAYFIKNSNLAKQLLKSNGGLARPELTSLAKEANEVSMGGWVDTELLNIILDDNTGRDIVCRKAESKLFILAGIHW